MKLFFKKITAPQTWCFLIACSVLASGSVFAADEESKSAPTTPTRTRTREISTDPPGRSPIKTQAPVHGQANKVSTTKKLFYHKKTGQLVCLTNSGRYRYVFFDAKKSNFFSANISNRAKLDTSEAGDYETISYSDALEQAKKENAPTPPEIVVTAAAARSATPTQFHPSKVITPPKPGTVLTDSDGSVIKTHGSVTITADTILNNDFLLKAGSYPTPAPTQFHPSEVITPPNTRRASLSDEEIPDLYNQGTLAPLAPKASGWVTWPRAVGAALFALAAYAGTRVRALSKQGISFVSGAAATTRSLEASAADQRQLDELNTFDRTLVKFLRASSAAGISAKDGVVNFSRWAVSKVSKSEKA